jgi:hypothetical protein
MCSGQVYIWDSLDALSHYIVLMMGTETVPERVLILNHLTWLINQENFINSNFDYFSCELKSPLGGWSSCYPSSFMCFHRSLYATLRSVASNSFSFMTEILHIHFTILTQFQWWDIGTFSKFNLTLASRYLCTCVASVWKVVCGVIVLSSKAAWLHIPMSGICCSDILPSIF